MRRVAEPWFKMAVSPQYTLDSRDLKKNLLGLVSRLSRRHEINSETGRWPNKIIGISKELPFVQNLILLVTYYYEALNSGAAKDTSM